MAAVIDLWGSWFSCCVAQPQKRRHRIDRSMIGEPTNFQHTAHLGSRDVEMPNDQLTALESQMRGKGGYDSTFKVSLWLLGFNSMAVLFGAKRQLPSITGGIFRAWHYTAQWTQDHAHAISGVRTAEY